ncbi:hypothetical protein MB09_00450 [Aequorivita vladivostokensis]|uniref:Secretion system C-terminal sorting domain-containing protein n=1 Tax=Aequorivita vladivostokensis TaxID=171194 RepID=A0ABR5DLN6_9FLAO|nr:hypothetical protein MB09_00450 [Aequorivita vladivostokensis]
MFSISVSSFAQDQRLFDNTWYLQKINIDGIDYLAPQNNEIDSIELNIYQDFFETIVCVGFSGHQLTISNTEINVFKFIIVPSDPCTLPENNIFENRYYNGFFEWQSSNRTFEYTIESQSNALSLILTNDLGNQAFYGNQALSNPNFLASQFSIYPNPAKDKLYLNATNPTKNLKVKIFNLEGRLLTNLNLENQTSMDVSNLDSGIYFLNIEDENGHTEVIKFLME